MLVGLIKKDGYGVFTPWLRIRVTFMIRLLLRSNALHGHSRRHEQPIKNFRRRRAP
jgi:hypothetical protein